MNEFNAILTDGRKIEIATNTYWSCKLEGNFKLSQYDGSGDTIIDIIIPEDIMFVEGNVYFTYGDERCEFPQMSLLFNNTCYIRTIPSYSVCQFEDKTENVIYLFYEEERETFNISVFSVNNWSVRNALNCIYLMNRNELMVVPLGEEGGELEIVPDECYDKKVIVKIIKRSQED